MENTNNNNIFFFQQSIMKHEKLVNNDTKKNIIQPTNSYWYRKTLEGLQFFTYLEPSGCWNIFC